MAGVLKHRDDVFCYIAHRDGVYHPIYVESEGLAAAAPLVNLLSSAGSYPPNGPAHLLTSCKACLMHPCYPQQASVA